MKTVTIENITEIVIDSLSSTTPPRLHRILSALIRHLHDFVRDVELSHDEWLQAMEFFRRAGDISDDRRNEFILLSDVVGLESLVDAISHQARERATESTVLGPFFRAGAPVMASGASIARRGKEDGPPVLLYGRVTDTAGVPIAGAWIDVWQTGPEGLYEQQDPKQPDMNLRGRFVTDEDGRYRIRTARPVSYPIPYDGPSGDLLQLTGRHPYRPAHIHMVLEALGYHTLVSQIYDSTDTYLHSDSVFAVKGSLIVDFIPARNVLDGLGVDTTDVDFIVEHDIRLRSANESDNADYMARASHG